MEITQVKMIGETVSVSWQTRSGPDGDEVVSHKLTGGEEPVPAFANAISDLREDVIALMELPEDWFGPASVVGLSAKHEEDAIEVSLSFKRTMRSGRVVGISTPRVRSRTDSSEEGSAFMSEETERRVRDVLRHAEDYVEGKRAQADIEDDDNGLRIPA